MDMACKEKKQTKSDQIYDLLGNIEENIVATRKKIYELDERLLGPEPKADEAEAMGEPKEVAAGILQGWIVRLINIRGYLMNINKKLAEIDHEI
jgi:hypothetical protein